jgi:hypothetical protein
MSVPRTTWMIRSLRAFFVCCKEEAGEKGQCMTMTQSRHCDSPEENHNHEPISTTCAHTLRDMWLRKSLSSLRRILKAEATWWFSIGDISLYIICRRGHKAYKLRRITDNADLMRTTHLRFLTHQTFPQQVPSLIINLSKSHDSPPADPLVTSITHRQRVLVLDPLGCWSPL